MNKVATDKPTPGRSLVTPNPTDRAPVLFTAIGRQRVGKTALLNVMAQVYGEAGAELDIWNVDLLNRSHSISGFFDHAVSPPSGGLEDQREWLQARILEQVHSRRDAILDVGGGWTALHQLIDQMRIVDVLERRGINLTVAYLLGTEAADLDYLAQFQDKGNFMPPQTILVLNEGLVTTGREAHTAFRQILTHPVVLRATEEGAQVAFMPALGCMAAVTDRKMSFRDFADDKQVPGFPETSFFDQELVALWLEREMPRFLEEIPANWLPRLPEGRSI